MENTSAVRRSAYRARSGTRGGARGGSHRSGATRSAARSARDKLSSNEFGEKVVMQCIVSGLIFAVVLGMTLVDSEITNDIRARVKSALSDNIAIEDVRNKTSEITEYLAVIQDTAKNILAYENKENAGEGADDLASDESAADGAFRIDEDILSIINAEEDAYSKNAKKP